MPPQNGMKASLLHTLMVAWFLTTKVLGECPTCLSTCITDMTVTNDTSLNCATNDRICFCNNPSSVGYIVSCSILICPDGTNTTLIRDCYTSYCMALTGGSIDPSASGSQTAITQSLPHVYTTLTAEGTVTVSIGGTESLSTYTATELVTDSRIYSSLLATASTTPAANSTANNDSHHGLSTGVKIGIGVGVPLGVLILAGIVFVFLWQRRKSKTHNITATEANALSDKSELHHDNLPRTHGRSELSTDKNLVTARSEPAEIGTTQHAPTNPSPGVS